MVKKRVQIKFPYSTIWMLLLLWGIFLVLPGCKRQPPDGHYCAKVTYQKQGSKSQGNFTIIVELKDKKLIDISFPEGHYDHSDIKPVDVPLDGKCTAISKAGYVYKVQMLGPAIECMKSANMVQCKVTTKNGNRCQRFTDNKNGLCWQHQKK
ncbi:MAG: hypothetical protein J5I52_01005 [Saprospiraceae bacterium]|nr:MAG: hypothetical protein UZ09_BCD002002347 [Bacteroidetes bacterium OLB9]MCO6462703.1 hypothetical protein [Saprospiraceae bacterium]MCZ2338574.1 hypothetical protein [Chitinophagales bacterium]